MFPTPGAPSGAWTDPLPSTQPQPAPEPKPQPPQRPALSVAQAHAHAFNTPKGWEAPERPSTTKDLSPPNPDAIHQSGSDRPKWVLPFKRFANEDLPYTAWEAVESPTSSVKAASRSPIPSSSSRSSVGSPGRTPRAYRSDVSRGAMSEPRSFAASSSYRTAKTHLTTWKWAGEAIPDPDFPDEKPLCLSPRSLSKASSPRLVAGVKKNRRTKSVGDATNKNGNDKVDDAVDEYFAQSALGQLLPPNRLHRADASKCANLGNG